MRGIQGSHSATSGRVRSGGYWIHLTSVNAVHQLAEELSSLDSGFYGLYCI